MFLACPVEGVTARQMRAGKIGASGVLWFAACLAKRTELYVPYMGFEAAGRVCKKSEKTLKKLLTNCSSMRIISLVLARAAQK